MLLRLQHYFLWARSWPGVMAFVIVTGLCAIWFVLTADFCAQRAASSLEKSGWVEAERWLAFGKWCPGPRGRLYLVDARLAWKRGQQERFDALLRLAKLAGAAASSLEQEQLVGLAAAGRLEPLKRRFADMLATGNDLPELCEGYVLGCLSNYLLDDAKQVLDLWQADFPQDARPHLLRGRLYEHGSEYERAINEFREAWRLAPQYAPAAYSLGRILMAQNRYSEAAVWYQFAANQMDVPHPALVRKARCLRELGAYDQAAVELGRARVSTGNQQSLEDAYRILGESAQSALADYDAEVGQVKLAQDDFTGARDAFAHSLAINPRDWRTRYAFSVALKRSGQVTQAEIEAKKVESAKQQLDACDRLMDVLQKNPRDVDARFQVGAAILDQVSENQGLIWLNSVLAIDPHHEPTHQKLANYYRLNADRNPAFSQQAMLHEHKSPLSPSRPAP